MAAAADVKVYGRAHVSLDYLDDGADYNEVGLSSNSSRLGFKAEQELENGMIVLLKLNKKLTFLVVLQMMLSNLQRAILCRFKR